MLTPKISAAFCVVTNIAIVQVPFLYLLYYIKLLQHLSTLFNTYQANLFYRF